MDAPVTRVDDNNRVVEGRSEDEIKRAEEYETLKRMLMRLLDDPQIQRKIVDLVRRYLKPGISGI